ncbi:MAG: hypothetical protein R3D98_00665 [Candidatus Krumholzibacteriia bacterium]
MTDRPRAPWQRLEDVIDRTPLDTEEKHRLKHYSVFLVLGAPTMLAFAVANALARQFMVAGAVTVAMFGLLIGWALLIQGRSPTWVYRANAVFYGGIVVYLAGVGGPDGSRLLWSYTFPPIAFFLLSRREGLVWVALVFGGTAALLFDVVPGVAPYAYSADFRSRYLVTFVIVALTAYWFEHFRQVYRLRMEAEQAELQRALDQVTALRGLLPICAACKKIRDEADAWVDLEAYIHDRSEARFSHGICPECAGRLYGDDYLGDGGGSASSSETLTSDGTTA